jgi:hypothetical protein
MVVVNSIQCLKRMQLKRVRLGPDSRGSETLMMTIYLARRAVGCVTIYGIVAEISHICKAKGARI